MQSRPLRGLTDKGHLLGIKVGGKPNGIDISLFPCWFLWVSICIILRKRLSSCDMLTKLSPSVYWKRLTLISPFSAYLSCTLRGQLVTDFSKCSIVVWCAEMWTGPPTQFKHIWLKMVQPMSSFWAHEAPLGPFLPAVFFNNSGASLLVRISTFALGS